MLNAQPARPWASTSNSPPVAGWSDQVTASAIATSADWAASAGCEAGSAATARSRSRLAPRLRAQPAALAGSRAVDFTIGLTTSSYRATSPGTTVSFLVGDALDLVPHARIPDPAACDDCHVSLRICTPSFIAFRAS